MTPRFPKKPRSWEIVKIHGKLLRRILLRRASISGPASQLAEVLARFEAHAQRSPIARASALAMALSVNSRHIPELVSTFEVCDCAHRGEVPRPTAQGGTPFVATQCRTEETTP